MKHRATGAACLAIVLAAATPALAREHGSGHGHVAGRAVHGGHFARGGAAHVAGRGFRGGYAHGYGRGYGYYGGYGYDGYGVVPDFFAGLFAGNLAYACGDTPYHSCYYGY